MSTASAPPANCSTHTSLRQFHFLTLDPSLPHIAAGLFHLPLGRMQSTLLRRYSHLWKDIRFEQRHGWQSRDGRR